MPPLLFVAIRFVVVVFPAVLLVGRPDAPWRVVAAVGVFMSLGQFGFLYVSMDAGMPPGLAALVLQAQVIFTVLIAAGVLREIPTGAQVAGVVARLGRPRRRRRRARRRRSPSTALALCLLGALSWGIGNVVSRASGVTGGLSLTVWSALVVPVPLLALSLALDGPAVVGDALASFSWQAGALHALHRRARLAGRVRHLQHPAVPQPVVLGGAVGAARAGRRDGVGLAAARPAAQRRRGGRRRCC